MGEYKMSIETETLNQTKNEMEKAIVFYESELSSIRTGRADPKLLQNIKVDYYGTLTPLNQLCTISTPEPMSLFIQPWDKQSIKEIERAIQISDLGLSPNNDGSIIRINIPPLSTERRQALVKMVNKKSEDTNVTIRNIRKNYLNKFREMEKNKSLSQDESKTAQSDLQTITNTFTDKVQSITKTKIDEIMEINK